MRFLAFLLPCAVLVACEPAGMRAGEPRQMAEQGARASLIGLVPDIALEAVTDCVADLTETSEMDRFIEANKFGASAASRQLALTILDRPETQTCIADNGVILTAG